jgi:hypothetical protein
MLEEGLFKDALTDEYYKELVKEYRILSVKYLLQPIHGWLWKFSRLRPVNFPTVRISQLSELLAVAGGLFSRIMEASDFGKLKELLECSASSYWDNHYLFGKKSITFPKKTGEQATDIFIINAIIPVIFIYGRLHNKYDVCERALMFLEEIDPEVNSVIRDWKVAGIETESAFYTQALLQLTDNYCRKRKCLKCRIGCKIISNGKKLISANELMLEP